MDVTRQDSLGSHRVSRVAIGTLVLCSYAHVLDKIIKKSYD